LWYETTDSRTQVKMRVELGPRELKKQQCVLVINETPGVPGKRQDDLTFDMLIERLVEQRKNG
jgi:hypothetical protein